MIPSEGRDVEPASPGEEAVAAHRAGERGRLLAATAVTFLIMFAEVVGGWFSNSLALLSDAGHMLTDTSALGLSFLALGLGARAADRRRTYGWYRLEILAALLNGALLLVVAGAVAVEAVRRIQAPEPVRAGPMLLVAVVGLCANAGGILILAREGASLNVRAALQHVVSDAVSSVAVVAGGLLILATGKLWIDPAISLAVSVLIVWGAARLMREAVNVLLEAVPHHLDLAEVLHAMEQVPDVARVHDLHIWTITSDMHALSAHVVVRAQAVGRNDEILEELKRLLRERFQMAHTTLQIESEAYAHPAEEVH